MTIEYYDAEAGFVDLHTRFDDVLSCTITKMKKDKTKYRCKYKGFWGVFGQFDLKIEKVKKEKNLDGDGKTQREHIFHVTLNELPKNKTTSVTNMIESLATMVKHQFLEEIENTDIRWFDKFENEEPNEVTMLWDDVRYSKPRWF